MGKPAGTLHQIATFMIQRPEKKWTVSEDKSILVDITRLDETGKYLARKALDLWSQATGLTFVETRIKRGDDNPNNDRGIQFYNSDPGIWSWLKNWDSKGAITNIVNFEARLYKNKAVPLLTLKNFMHEIGHALGLNHPGRYNGSGTYDSASHFANDSFQLTVMSYFDQKENYWLNASRAYPATPMAADILSCTATATTSAPATPCTASTPTPAATLTRLPGL